MHLVERAKNIILSPGSEWDVIKDEDTSIADLYKQYVLPLAAIPAVSQTIGMAAVGMTMPFAGTVRLGWGAAITHGILNYAIALIGVFVIALVIDALAPAFGGQKNLNQAVKVTAYAWTPGWLGGIFTLVPMLGILGLLASLYGLYLLYLGLPRLMASPRDKAVGYTLVVIVCAIVVMIVLGIVVNVIAGPTMPMADMPQINIQIPAQ